MDYRVFVSALAGLGVCVLGGSAHAAGSAAAGLAELSELNLVVLNDMHGGDDVEGPAFVGGNLSNAATFALGASANPGQGYKPSSYATLTVGGSLGGNANINSGISSPTVWVGGNVGTINLNAHNTHLTVGGSISSFNGGMGDVITAGGSANGNANGATVNANQGAGFGTTTQQDIAAQAATLKADMGALSGALGALGATTGSGFNISDPNNATLTAVNSGLGYAVIDITAAQLEAARNLVFSIQSFNGGYLPTIINVTGATGTIDITANNNNAAYGPDLIWNFGNASNIDFQSEFNGSVLAPDATVSNSTQINGSVVANIFDQGGEVHLGTWEGSSDLTAALSPTTSVPEPAAWALMIAGFGLAGASLRRRFQPAALTTKV